MLVGVVTSAHRNADCAPEVSQRASESQPGGQGPCRGYCRELGEMLKLFGGGGNGSGGSGRTRWQGKSFRVQQYHVTVEDVLAEGE